MKKKRYLYLLMTLVMLFTTVFGNAGIVLGEDGSTTVAEWAFTANYSENPELPVAATGGVRTSATLNMSSGLTLDSFNAKYGLQATKWTAMDEEGVYGYWLFDVDTSGYENLTFTAKQRSSNAGPGHFKLQYRTSDSAEWTDVPEGSAVLTSSNQATTYDALALPEDTANCSSLQLRVVMADLTRANSSSTSDVDPGGNSAIDSIVISGTPMTSTSEDPGEATAAPSDETTAPGEETEAPTTPAPGEETAAPDTLPETVEDGEYVIWNVDAAMALDSTVKSSYYLNGVSVTGDSTGVSGVGGTGLWTVEKQEDGTYTITQGDLYLGVSVSGTYNNLKAIAAPDHTAWTIALNEAKDGYVLTCNSQYLYWDTTYTDWTVKSSTSYATSVLFTKYVEGSSETEAPATTAPGEETEAPATTAPDTLPETVEDGTYVIWNPVYEKSLSSTMTGNYYAGVSVSGSISMVSGYGNTELWEVTANDDGTYSIKQDGKYIGLNASGYLTVAEAPATTAWTIEVNDGYYNLKCGSKYLKWISSYSDWSMYNYSTADADMFKLWLTSAAKVYDTDSDVVEDIAQWGGGGPYDEQQANQIYADLLDVGDMLDTNAAFSVVAKGVAAQPYSTGTNNYYMGGVGIGAGEGDYMQFALSTKGWGDMTMSFRLRASKAAPGSFRLQYSTDGGGTFLDFTTGSYSYKYTQYTSDSSYEVSDSGKITDGIAKTSLAPTYYVSFSFDVPDGAENCEALLIRLVPGTEKASGASGAIDGGGTIRIDSVVISGSPIVDDGVVSYVTADPDGAEEDQAPGTAITLTCGTKDAQISYRFVDENGEGEWKTYSTDDKPVLPGTLPAYLQVYAAADGLQDSVTRLFTYAAGTVSGVKFAPNGGGVYIAGEQESVTITLSCETDGATIYYNVDEKEDSDGNLLYKVYDAENASDLVLAKGFESKVVKAYAVKEGFTTSSVATRTFTERSQEKYNIYFGQLHSHTSYSDGAGDCETAFKHASAVENLDFLAVTDHSNSFDNAGDSVLSEDASAISEEWAGGKALAKAYTTDDFVSLFGFEMTWSNGLGHINTYNTPGFQSRTQSAYTTYATALQNYYATLETVSDSISQFNHPGTTFGDFSDFSYYDEEIDDLITLIEVGNGEGAIGSSGYFPSYEYYTRALDKGWHVAPTNNQDNHKGNWGDSNTARSVVLSDDLTEESIYDAMRNYRVYATEDNDLSIYYTLDDNIMGTILDEDMVGEKVTLAAAISDPTDEKIGKVEVIVNGGLSIASETVDTNEETVTFDVSSDYSYYYLKITEADGDIAVTAPVWVGDVEAAGISSLSTDATLPVQNEALNVTLDLYNNEAKALEITGIEFTVKKNDEVIDTITVDPEEAKLTKVGSMSTASYIFQYTYDGLGSVSINATVTGVLNGVEKSYTDVLKLSYVSNEMVTRVIVDGTHYNDYVTGYYGGNMTEFADIAAKKNVLVTVEKEKITADMLADCALLIISAPARKSETSNSGSYTASTFEDEFITMVADYVKAGGTVILCGLADYQDKNASNGADGHAAAQMNKLLTAIGSTMHINDDEVIDAEHNGGQPYRLYPESFNAASAWTSGIVTADSVAEGVDYQTYSQYSGCSVNVGDGTWIVKGWDSTWGADSDKDGVGVLKDADGNPISYSYEYSDTTYTYDAVTDKGDVVFLASEEVGEGTVFAAGGVFMSDFEIDADVDDYALPYANQTIIENILDGVSVELPLSTIAQMRDGNMGDVFRIQGYVTAGTANEDTSFFDAIYVQDETGGTTVFPFAEEGVKIGTKIEITGYVDAYQGDKEIQIMSYKILDEDPVVYEPKKVSNKEAMDYEKNGGQLLQVEGVVQDIVLNDDGTVSQFVVKDEAGDLAKIFIDGYILSGTTGKNELASFVKEGNTVSAAGLLYMHPEGDSDESVAVLRVRDCDEIVLVAEPTEEPTPTATYWYGDTNLDGSVTAEDALLILQYVVKLTDLRADSVQKTQLRLVLSDVNHDDTITALDALYVLQTVVELRDKEAYTGPIVIPAETENPAAETEVPVTETEDPAAQTEDPATETEGAVTEMPAA